MSAERCARAVRFYASLKNAAHRHALRTIHAPASVPPLLAVSSRTTRFQHPDKTQDRSCRRAYSSAAAVDLVDTEVYRHLPQHQSQQKSRYEDLSTAQIYERLGAHAQRGRHDLVLQAIDYLTRERGEQPNLRLYSALILAECDPMWGSSYGLERTLKEMKQEQISIDSGICHDMLKALAVHPDFLLRNDVIALMKHHRFPQTIETRSDIATGQLREGSIESGLQTIETLQADGHPVPAWLYDIAIHALINWEDIDRALELIMTKSSIHADSTSPALCVAFLDAASDRHHLAATRWLWKAKVLPGHVTVPLGTCLSVLATAAEHGEPELATEACRKLASLGQPLGPLEYEHLCQAYLLSRRPNLAAALSTVSLMLGNHIQPLVSLTSLFTEFFQGHAGAEEETLKILRKLHEKGRRIAPALLNAVIGELVRRKDAYRALEVYKHMHEFEHEDSSSKSRAPMANVETFQLLFQVARHIRPVEAAFDMAVFLWDEMQALGLPMNRLMYDRFLGVCIEAKRLGEALRLHQRMRDREWEPRAGTAKALSALYAEKGNGGSAVKHESEP